MKIRNIESYIQKRLSRHNWNVDKKKIGSDNEPFLLATFGDEQKVDNLFKRVSEIATNAEEQIFYELVQNAHDVHATSLYFYVSEDYLLVINNGNVFKTDDEDSLFNFLAFNKSDKSDEKGDWGEKGIGAKTMYTLISDVEDSKKSFDLLHKAIKEDRKGPYLISWNNRNQLDCLLQNRTGWEATEDNDALLFIKIILCYYPMIPKNEEYNYFKVEEAEKVVRILNEGIKPIGNIAFLEQGTALIVPLGKNKYNERIRSRETDIRENLGLFQCFDSSKQDIQYCQEIIHRENVKERDIKWNDNGAVHEYKFVFNKAFADKKICNLFKDLPINETKAGLGFVINSKDFDLDGSRQRVSEPDKTRFQLEKAFEGLIENLEQDNNIDFEEIYESLLKTNIPETDSFAYIKKPFDEKFKDFFEKHVQTEDRQYVSSGNVVYFDDEKQHLISLSDIGINRKWVRKEIKENNNRHGVSITSWSFSDILKNCDRTKLEMWLQKLSALEYKDLFEKIIDITKDKDSCPEYKLFRTNKGNLFSYKDLKSSHRVFFKSKSIGSPCFGDFECVVYPIEINDEEYINLLTSKLKSNIEYFREHTEDSANVIKWILDKDIRKIDEIKNIELLKNLNGEYVSFANAIEARPLDTSIFDRFVVHIPQDLKGCDLVLNPNGNEVDFWNWLFKKHGNSWNSTYTCEKWSGLISNDDWRKSGIKDLKTVYHGIPNQKQSEELSTAIDAVECNNCIELLPLVEEKCYDKEIVSKFCNKIDSLNIDNELYNEDYEWRTIKLVDNSVDVKEDVFKKIKYKKSSLPGQINTNEVYVGNNRYELSVLSDKYKSDNESLILFFSLLPDERWFKETFYKGKENQKIRTDEVYDEIKNSLLSLQQLEFCIDYSLSPDNKGNLKKDLKANCSLEAALEMIEEHRFKGFDEYFKLNCSVEDFKKKCYIENRDDSDLLLDDEKVDNEVIRWIEEKKDRIELFKCLRKSEYVDIKVRKAIKENKPTSEVVTDRQKLIDWIVKNRRYNNFTRTEARYKILENISKNYSFQIIPDTAKVKYSLSKIDNQAKWIDFGPYQKDFEEWMKVDANLRRLINENVFVRFKLHESLSSQYYELKKEESGEIRSEEWRNETYKDFKKENNSDFSIYVSKEPIKINFRLLFSGVEEMVKQVVDGDFWMENKKVFVRANENNWEEVLSIISDHCEESKRKEMTDAFFRLQTYLIKRNPKGTKNGDISLKNSPLDKDIAQKVIDTIPIEFAKQIEELRDISKMGITPKQIIKKIEEEKEKGSNPDEEVGDIGEELYKKYLEKKGIKPKKTNGADLLIEKGNERYYIDIKTNNKTLTDGNAPFYIHTSQDNFMKGHPDENYYLIRISLPDLKIKKDADVNHYFDNNSIDDFEQKIKEYKISLKSWQEEKK